MVGYKEALLGSVGLTGVVGTSVAIGLEPEKKINMELESEKSKEQIEKKSWEQYLKLKSEAKNEAEKGHKGVFSSNSYTAGNYTNNTLIPYGFKRYYFYDCLANARDPDDMALRLKFCFKG